MRGSYKKIDDKKKNINKNGSGNLYTINSNNYLSNLSSVTNSSMSKDKEKKSIISTANLKISSYNSDKSIQVAKKDNSNCSNNSNLSATNTTNNLNYSSNKLIASSLLKLGSAKKMKI